MMTIAEAERAISKILAALETATGDWVEAVHIDDIEATTVCHDRQFIQRTVRIEMRLKPGSGWD